MSHAKVLLIVLDGWGINEEYQGNAISLAKKPFYDSLWHNYPHLELEASGLSVGLPEGQMGTSEVNHFTIGAGRIVYQELVRVNQAISDQTFFTNEVLVNSCQEAVKRDKPLHILGLVSTGGVHSHQDHIIALVELAKQQGVKEVFLHAFTDGRDATPQSGITFLQEVEQKMNELGLGRIVSIVGRYYAMDRDHNWDRTDMAFDLITQAKGEQFTNVTEAMQASYKAQITDEFVTPKTIVPEGLDPVRIMENDVVIFANFRNDRPRQLTERLLEKGPRNIHLTTMTQYKPDYPVKVAFGPQNTSRFLGEVISEHGLKQLRVTETEKFAHMTFFINCKQEKPTLGEDRLMFDSNSDIKTHDERPEMKAMEIAQAIVEDIQNDRHQVIFTNLCNADMVGHSGNIPAAIKAVETVDSALSMIIPVALEHSFDVIITADHGNADEMLNEKTGEMITSHSLNNVPFILISNRYKQLAKNSGSLIDVAPTILRMLELPIPTEMTGTSLA